MILLENTSSHSSFDGVSKQVDKFPHTSGPMVESSTSTITVHWGCMQLLTIMNTQMALICKDQIIWQLKQVSN